MKPGNELDELIASKVMGVDISVYKLHSWELYNNGKVYNFAYDHGNHNGPRCTRCDYYYCHHCQKGPTEPCKITVFSYSTNISSAWRLVEKLQSKGFGLEIMKSPNLKYMVSFLESAPTVEGETAPHAICLAVLKALEIK